MYVRVWFGFRVGAVEAHVKLNCVCAVGTRFADPSGHCVFWVRALAHRAAVRVSWIGRGEGGAVVEFGAYLERLLYYRCVGRAADFNAPRVRCGLSVFAAVRHSASMRGERGS